MTRPTGRHSIMWSMLEEATQCGLALFAIILLLSEPMCEVGARPLWRSVQTSVDTSIRAQGEKDLRLLEPGKPIERELAGGEIHTYQITLAAGQYLHVVVDQRGIDIVVVLRGPDGAQLMEMDGLSGMIGTEELVWEAATNGEYVLEVRARAKQANKGRYEVRLQTAAGASGRERARIAAQRLFMEGRGGQAEGRRAGLERRIKNYEEAVAKWREAGERKWEGLTLDSLGSIYWNLSQYEKARDYYEQSLAIRREIKDRTGEVRTLDNIGRIYYDLMQFDKARECLEQALAISREVKDRTGEGWTLHYLGDVHRNLSQYEEAQERYEQALAIWYEIKDRTGEGSSLRGVGHVYWSLSQYEKARDYYEQALAIWYEIKGRSNEADTLYNLGNVYVGLSQYEKSRDYYEKAREYYEHALAIWRDFNYQIGEWRALTGLGGVYAQLSQYEKAREYFEQVLAISREIKNRRGEAEALYNLGFVYGELGQYDKAREYYKQALAIWRESRKSGASLAHRRGEGRVLNNLGDLYHRLSQYDKAHEYLEQALAIWRENKDRSGEVETLYGIARLELARGNLNQARTQIEPALAIIESLRTTIRSQELRSSYFASVQDYYGLHIDLLMRLHKQRPLEGHDAAALQASERERARGLLELLTEARADIRQGVDTQLIEQERSLQQQLNAQAERQTRLLSGKHTPEQAAAVEKQIEALSSEFQKIQAQIRVKSPRYAALTQPQPLSLREIQTEVLDTDTLLLEYALGEERSYLWAVTPTSISSFELPKRTEIEAAARRLYESFSTSNPLAAKPQAEAAMALSQILLGPVATQLGRKRLLIVADGALQFIPFAALPRPLSLVTGHLSLAQGQKPETKDKGPRTKDQIPLILDHEIVSLPSASTLALLRRESRGRKPAAKLVAVLADPVFDPADPRVRPGVGGQGAGVREKNHPLSTSPLLSTTVLERSASETGLISFDRLRSTRREALEILALSPEADSLKALDFQASRATAMSEELGQYRIVHFATHGLLNSQHPELSGIVLSLVDEAGKPQDGFLRAHEVFNLKLEADLVVLSGCQTALGKQVKGEGLLGLTRGFMYAGSPRVVASLWRVPDKATSELMKQFYRRLLVEGMTPAAALRAAQVGMWRENRWAEPYYWAAFVLQGEWQLSGR